MSQGEFSTTEVWDGFTDPSCGHCSTRQDNRWATWCRSRGCKFAGKEN